MDQKIAKYRRILNLNIYALANEAQHFEELKKDVFIGNLKVARVEAEEARPGDQLEEVQQQMTTLLGQVDNYLNAYQSVDQGRAPPPVQPVAQQPFADPLTGRPSKYSFVQRAASGSRFGAPGAEEAGRLANPERSVSVAEQFVKVNGLAPGADLVALSPEGGEFVVRGDRASKQSLLRFKVVQLSKLDSGAANDVLEAGSLISPPFPSCHGPQTQLF